MNDFNQTYGDRVVVGAGDMARDEGLRKFMLGVYNKMALGLVWSALLAYVVGTWAPATAFVFSNPPVLMLVQFGPLALLFGSMFFMRNPSPAGANALYWSVVSLIGTGLSVWVLAAAQNLPLQSVGGATMSIRFETIALALTMTASAFAGLSLWGYTTKRDLSGWGSFIMMGVVGAIVLGLLNIWFKSSVLELGIQFAVLGLMAGLVAFKTQALKVSYYHYAGNDRAMSVMTTFGALDLYIAFINMFQIILSLLGRE